MLAVATTARSVSSLTRHLGMAHMRTCPPERTDWYAASMISAVLRPSRLFRIRPGLDQFLELLFGYFKGVEKGKLDILKPVFRRFHGLLKGLLVLASVLHSNRPFSDGVAGFGENARISARLLYDAENPVPFRRFFLVLRHPIIGKKAHQGGDRAPPLPKPGGFHSFRCTPMVGADPRICASSSNWINLFVGIGSVPGASFWISRCRREFFLWVLLH